MAAAVTPDPETKMDPRTNSPSDIRKTMSKDSPFMRAFRSVAPGTVINACPFGCEDDKLDELGGCAHLIGFYNGGETFEPRVAILDRKGKPTGKTVVLGDERKPMKRGYKLVKLTTSARVYSPVEEKTLTFGRNTARKEIQAEIERERRLVEMAERVRNPVLQGDWEPTAYDEPAAAATVPK